MNWCIWFSEAGVKTFPSPGYLCSKDGVAWLWQLLLNLNDSWYDNFGGLLISAPKFKKGRKKIHNAVNKKIGTSCPELSTKQLDQLTMVSNMVVPWVDPQLDITIPKPKLELYISPVAPSHLQPPNKSSVWIFTPTALIPIKIFD